MFRIGDGVKPISRHIHTRVEPDRDMETVNSEFLSILALGGGLGTLLVWLAERYSLLEHRDEGRCPACGVLRDRGVCGCNR